MSEPKVDTLAFKRRVAVIQKKIGSGEFSGVEFLLAVVGLSDEEYPYQKSSILHNWLLGYEFPANAILISKEKDVFVTFVGKAKYVTGRKSNIAEEWIGTHVAKNNK